jgi:hypothetical protein
METDRFRGTDAFGLRTWRIASAAAMSKAKCAATGIDADGYLLLKRNK